jgi:plastocyanin
MTPPARAQLPPLAPCGAALLALAVLGFACTGSASGGTVSGSPAGTPKAAHHRSPCRPAGAHRRTRHPSCRHLRRPSAKAHTGPPAAAAPQASGGIDGTPPISSSGAGSSGAAQAPPESSSPGSPPPSVPHVQVTAVEYGLTLSRSTVPAGKVVLEFVNRGQDEHNLNATPLEGPLTASFANAVSGTIVDQQIEMRPGTYTLFCSLPEHEQKGMKATLVVN